MPVLHFWYEFASPYSRLAAARVDEVAAAAGVAVRWRPFLLGPIFADQGWNTSPFNLYPAKGRYLWRDVGRIARGRGLPSVTPAPFPQNGLVAARLATIGVADGWVAPFSKAVFEAEFGAGRDISDHRVLGGLLADLGLEPEPLIARARTDQVVKERLRAETEEARSLGIFGAPSFVTEDGEMFWGDDRLADALAWAAAGGDPAWRGGR